MNKHKIGDIVHTMGHWFRVIGSNGNRLSIRFINCCVIIPCWIV